ncbi:MAG: hypothetical protein JW861_07355 [Bacteroidales bacterium]|nr:hypothetical protein [Bacteroidales bacterium]
MTSKSNRALFIFKMILLLILGGATLTLTPGCKSKKKLAMEQAAREYAEKVEKAKAELRAILNDDGTMPISEMERRLLDIRNQNLNDPEVNELMAQVEAKIVAMKEELRKREEEERKRQQEEEEAQKKKQSYDYIEDYFFQIAGSNDINEANTKISEAMKLYSSDQVPVLIIISQEGDITDYDKPTTIGNYLNYLKDVKKYDCKIHQARFDEYGQITELELIKK